MIEIPIMSNPMKNNVYNKPDFILGATNKTPISSIAAPRHVFIDRLAVVVL